MPVSWGSGGKNWSLRRVRRRSEATFLVGKAGFERATSASRILLQAFLTDCRCLVSLVESGA